MASSRHSDLTDLLMPIFSGNTRDDFGKEIAEPFPLSFDRINEGRPFSSSFLLSRLPLELVWHIVKLVPDEDLGNLALVNRDCRQLARSRQFATIKFDYSNSATGILCRLLMECKERIENNGNTRTPSLGACIRKITVATDPRWITHRHNIELSEEFSALETDVRTARLNDACEMFFGNYMFAITLLLSNAIALPRLESLTWADMAPVDHGLFKAIVSLNLRHLCLDRVSLSEEVPLNLLSDHCRWRLESLHLDLVPHWKRNIPVASLVSSLICLASPTLKSLAETSLSIPTVDSSSLVLPDLAKGYPSFPRLQDLRIDDLKRYNPTWLDVLVQPGGPSPIRYLEIDICENEVVADFFCKCGYLPNLEIFVWKSFMMKNPVLDFLQANTHIRKLRIDGTAPGFLEEKLLPLLHKQFNSLTSLSLKWPEDQNRIPPTALKQISSLRTLEQLRLSAGYPIGWRYTWLIDHAAMQDCVRNLPNLRKLAFSRDTYVEQNSDSQFEEDPKYYYEDKRLRNMDTILTRANFLEDGIEGELERAWEIQHLNDMSALAVRYASNLPELEWIYMGQRPMRIVRSSTGTAKAIPLSARRDDCWTYLRQLFGKE